mmetsp:Transcript_91162/g.195537  ORF Transcript_91162/g.195537 Transcript_91162/m.195537 type:complete len:272 (+) Transcript_91162:143-958(+)
MYIHEKASRHARSMGSPLRPPTTRSSFTSPQLASQCRMARAIASATTIAMVMPMMPETRRVFFQTVAAASSSARRRKRRSRRISFFNCRSRLMSTRSSSEACIVLLRRTGPANAPPASPKGSVEIPAPGTCPSSVHETGTPPTPEGLLPPPPPLPPSKPLPVELPPPPSAWVQKGGDLASAAAAAVDASSATNRSSCLRRHSRRRTSAAVSRKSMHASASSERATERCMSIRGAALLDLMPPQPRAADPPGERNSRDSSWRESSFCGVLVV